MNHFIDRSRRRLLSAALLAILLAGAGLPAAAQGLDSSAPPQELDGIGIDQNLDEQLPLDLKFRDEHGNDVVLGDYFGQKPVILNLVYYECPMLCTLVLNGLLRSINPMRFTAGREYEIVTVSIDPHETPELAQRKKAEYMRLYDRPGAEDGWHFLTGGAEEIRQLAEAVGFRYKYDPETDLYLHASGIMVLTPKGKLARYFYGIDYNPTNLRLGLVEAASERIGSPVDKLLLFCFAYDPAAGKYSLVIMNVVRLLALLTIGSVAAFMITNFLRDRRRTAAAT